MVSKRILIESSYGQKKWHLTEGKKWYTPKILIYGLSCKEIQSWRCLSGFYLSTDTRKYFDKIGVKGSQNTGKSKTGVFESYFDVFGSVQWESIGKNILL